MNLLSSSPSNSVSICSTINRSIIDIKSAQHVLKRPMSQCNLIQDTKMMYFQQLVMKQAKSALRAKSLSSFTNPMSIIVDLISMHPPSTVYIEKLLKSILDGLNGNVVNNDSLIMNAQINHIKGLIRYPKTKITLELSDLVTADTIKVSLDLPPIEKVNPLPYDIDGTMNFHPSYITDKAIIEQQLAPILTASNTKYNECHIVVRTSNNSNDVDNLTLLYLEVLRDYNIIDFHRIDRIGMYKRYSSIADEGVVINLFSS